MPREMAQHPRTETYRQYRGALSYVVFGYFGGPGSYLCPKALGSKVPIYGMFRDYITIGIVIMVLGRSLVFGYLDP